MDVNEVVKGIEHFFRNLLPKAYSSIEWDEDGITNAFHWAEFCEQIYKTYKVKPSKNKFDEVIHTIGLNFKDVNQVLCFEDLKKCINILCEAFFENPSVENHIIQSVLLTIKSDKSSFEAVNVAHELDSICVELLEALRPIKIVNSVRSLYYEIKAEIYLNLLKDTTQHMTTEDQVENYLSSSLEKLCETTDQLVLLLHILMIKLPEETFSSLKEIQEFAINWLTYKIMSEEDCALAHFIWKLPSNLRAVTLNSSDFLSVYLDFLTRWSSSFRCESRDSETVWIPRFPGNQILSFSEILTHFRCLLGTEDDVSEFTKKHLLHLLNAQPEVLIWKEIFSRVT